MNVETKSKNVLENIIPAVDFVNFKKSRKGHHENLKSYKLLPHLEWRNVI